MTKRKAKGVEFPEEPEFEIDANLEAAETAADSGTVEEVSAYRNYEQGTAAPETAGGAGDDPVAPVQVKYTGPWQAVLGERAILHGETRWTTRHDLDKAVRAHPGQFEIVE